MLIKCGFRFICAFMVKQQMKAMDKNKTFFMVLRVFVAKILQNKNFRKKRVSNTGNQNFWLLFAAFFFSYEKDKNR